MASPIPKYPEERRNRTKPQGGEWIYVGVERIEEADTVLPARCYVDPKNEWDEETAQAWSAWRSDSVTTYYTPADVQYAIDTIRLYQRDFVRHASEIRLRMDSLALTPDGKRRQRYRIIPSMEVGHEAPKAKSIP